jgi:hypothetical protein
MCAFLVCTTNIQKISDVCPRVLKHVVGYRGRNFPFAGFQLLKVVVCDLVDKVLHITPQEKFSGMT